MQNQSSSANYTANPLTKLWLLLFLCFNQAFENMKNKAKKALSSDRVEKLKTGGGQVDGVDEKNTVVAWQPQKVYDGDANYNNESCLV